MRNEAALLLSCSSAAQTMVFFLMYEYVMYAQINIANVFKLLILAFVEEMSIQEALYVFRS